VSSGVVAAVLLAALLHAGWNALIKGGADKALDTALIHGIASLLAAPLVLLAGWPAREAWPFLAASVVVHFGYYVALVGAYRHGDLGLAYPVMRGTAPLIVACGSLLWLGERPGALAWAGVAAVSLGVLALGLGPGLRRQGVPVKALGFAIANAAIIAAYTLIDGRGVRLAGDALAYTATLFLFEGLPFLGFVLWRRREQWAAVRAHAAARWPLATTGAAASLAAYGIALWAMTRAPVASVSALREVSVLFAAGIGTFWLKEHFGAWRALGTLLVVAGIGALRLG
jgi:phosphonate utilization associated putative membrane protein